MSSGETIARPARSAMGFFERYLTAWVALCIVGGILLGQMLPLVFQAIGRMEVAQVNLPVGILITVVGVLIEVPVMLLVVGVVNRSQHWYEAKHGIGGQSS